MRWILMAIALFLSHNVFAETEASPSISMTSEKISLPVFVDVLSVHDIDGSVDGVYADATEALTGALVSDIRGILHPKGNYIIDTFTSNGLLLENGFNLFYAKDDVSTGVRFEKIYSSNFPDALKATAFFSDIIKEVRAQGGKLERSHVFVPPEIRSFAPEYLLFVQASTRGDVPFGKSLAIGMATGLVAGTAFMPVDGGEISIALVNTKTFEVLSMYRKGVKGIGKIQQVINKMLNVFAKDEFFDTADNITLNNKTVTDIYSIKTVGELKVAFKSGTISADEYKNMLTNLKQIYLNDLKSLNDKKDLKLISEPLFEVLATKLRIDFNN